MEVGNLVERIVDRYGTTDPFQLADYLNIEVFENPLGDIDGMYMYLKRNKVVLLNDNLNLKFKKFVLSHELGHGIMHPRENCYFMRKNTFLKMNKYEYEANLFAVNLSLHGIDTVQYKDMTVEQIACSEGVPKELLELKINHDKSRGFLF